MSRTSRTDVNNAVTDDESDPATKHPGLTSDQTPLGPTGPAESDPRGIDHGEELPTREATLAIGLIFLAVGLSLNSSLGPLMADVIDYPVSASMRNQTIGLDAAALIVFAPLCLAVAIMAWRGHRSAAVLALSLGSYAAYISVQYLVGPEFAYYPRTFILHMALVVCGWTLAGHSWTLSRRTFAEVPPLSRRHAVAALAIAGFVLLRYIPALVASFTERPLPTEASGDITMYWLIVVSDLGIFIPLAIVTARGVLHQATWARLAVLGLVGWFTIVSVAIGAMSLTMIVTDDRYASRAQLGLFTVTTVLAVGYSIHLHRAFLRESRLAASSLPFTSSEVFQTVAHDGALRNHRV